MTVLSSRAALPVPRCPCRAVLPVAGLIVSAAARCATAIRVVAGVVATLAAGLLWSLLAVCLPAALGEGFVQGPGRATPC